jgi:putative ABC transport system permease protein
MLGQNPGFTPVAVISLAIGIGASAAMFSWADALLLRPLPDAQPGEVVSVGSSFARRLQQPRKFVPRLQRPS